MIWVSEEEREGGECEDEDEDHSHLVPSLAIFSLPITITLLSPRFNPPRSLIARSDIICVQSLSRGSRHLHRPLGHRGVAGRGKMPQRFPEPFAADKLLGLGSARARNAR